MKQYSNPRVGQVVPDWPYGSMRTTACFSIESNSRGERAVRMTVNPKTGKLTAPKTLTYAKRARIVDGDDGRLYIAELPIYGTISIMRGTMDFSEESFNEEDARYPQLYAALTA